MNGSFSCIRRANICLVAALIACGWASQQAQGQANNGQAGVVVDASGVLRKSIQSDPTGQLTRQRLAAAKSALSHEVAEPSALRKVSLNRLEKALAALVQSDRPPTVEMRYLAGLTRVKYVFLYPDSGDIVLAGPAEGWMEDLSGRVRGMITGRPVIELQDLAAAMRLYPPEGDGGIVIGCSIDPTAEGLARMQEFLRQIGTTIGPNDQDHIVEGLRTSLGLQNVRVLGVSPTTHFAQVLVEADYRMKLIGIGLERPPVRMASFVDKANPSDVGRNALQRWYFTPNYDCVRMSDDALAMELVGDGVKLVGEDEVVSAGGDRRRASKGSRASQAFVADFTRKYPELASKEPVYAQLRNLIDLSIVAAYLQQQGYYDQVGWTASTLRDEQQLPIETYRAPVQVETVVTAVWKGITLMTPVGGGVNVQAELALDPSRMLPDEEGQVQKVRESTPVELAEGQWWWD